MILLEPMTKVLDENGKELNSVIVLSVGEILNEELNARKIHKGVFASLIGIKASNLSEILKDKRSISCELAIKIETQLGIKAEYFLQVQMNRQLAKIREVNK